MIGYRLAQRYELLKELEPGNLSKVYLAEDPLLERRVIVKLFNASAGRTEPLDLEALLAEGRRIASLSHPAIARLFDVGRHDDAVFFVLPRLRGRSLDVWCRERELEFGELLAIGAEIAEALAYAADQGVLHRDVRPETLQVTREHGELRCWLTGFYPVADRPSPTTEDGGPAICRTPEAVANRGVDHRSDLYCLALIVRDALVGGGARRPTARGSRSAEGSTAGWIPGLAPELDTELDHWLARTLAEDPEARPADGRELAAALRSIRDRAGEAVRRRRPVGRGIRSTFQRPTLVGRREELELFDRRLGRLEDRGSHCVLIGAEAGMGSTRLLEELEQKARERGFTVLWSRFTRRDGGVPLGGFQNLFEELLRYRTERGETNPPSFETLLPTLAELLPNLFDAPPANEAAIGGQGPPLPLQEAPEVLARALMALGGERPMVLLVENLHGDDTSFEALAHILHRLGPKPVLVAGTYRPNELASNHPLRRFLRDQRDHPRLDVLRLGPLSATDHAQLLAVLLRLPRVPPALAAELWEASDGNPYFTRELVRSLVESGDLPRPGTPIWPSKTEGIPGLGRREGERDIGAGLPDGIARVVERRLEGLEPELVSLLETASVLGRGFDLRLLRDIDERPAERVEDGIDELVRLGLLEEEGRAYGGALRFSGSVLHDVLYHRIPGRRRRALHRRCAETMERRWDGRQERIYPLLVHHFGSADRPVETLTYALMLARHSADRWSPREVARAARRGLTVLARGDLGDGTRDRGEIEGELRRLLATALQRQGSTFAAAREAGASAGAFDKAAERAAAARSAALAAQMAWQGRQVVTARRWSRWALERWPDAEHESAGRRLLALGALLADLDGDCQRAEACRLRLVQGTADEATSAPRDKRPGRDPRVSIPLRIALGETVGTLDPARARGLAIEPSAAVYETLFRRRLDGGIEPWLVSSWHQQGPTRLELELRTDVRFHDGRKLSAETVRRAFERLAQLEGRGGASPIESLVGENGDGLVGVEVLGPSRLRLTPRYPEPLLPWLLASHRSAIALQARREAEEPVGTGPYRVLRSGSRSFELSAFTSYWRAGRPRCRNLVLEHGMATETMLDEAHAGTLALALGLPQRAVQALCRGRLSGVRPFETPAFSTVFLLLDSRGPALRTRRARRSLLASLALERWLAPALGYGALPASSFWPPGLPGSGGRPVDEAALGSDAEPEAHLPRQLVAWIDETTRRDHETLWQGLALAFTRRGIDLEIRASSEEARPRSSRYGGVDLLFARWDASYLDSAAFLDMLCSPTSAALLPPELVERARTARRCFDFDRRCEQIRQIHRELWEEALLIPLGHEQHHGLAAAELADFTCFPVRPELRFEDLSLRPEAPAPSTVDAAMTERRR